MPEHYIPDVYVVRAEFGTYTKNFLEGGYVGIGWLDNNGLSSVKNREEIKRLYEEEYPNNKSMYVIGQQVGQISRFLFDIKPGDYIITPDSNSEYIHWCILRNEPYYYDQATDGCPYRHRRKVDWKDKIQRSKFSVPFQNSIRASLSVFKVIHKNNFFKTIGKHELVQQIEDKNQKTVNEIVLERILELTAIEFETLIMHLLTALGFETKHTGKVGDEGVDVIGELDLYGIAKINLRVQAKRYGLDRKISASTVRELRSKIPSGDHGAFFTTSDFQESALQVAVEPGFPRIGTINGEQLVDLLSEKWEELQLPEELKNKLGLKRGLVLE